MALFTKTITSLDTYKTQITSSPPLFEISVAEPTLIKIMNVLDNIFREKIGQTPFSMLIDFKKF